MLFKILNNVLLVSANSSILYFILNNLYHLFQLTFYNNFIYKQINPKENILHFSILYLTLLNISNSGLNIYNSGDK